MKKELQNIHLEKKLVGIIKIKDENKFLNYYISEVEQDLLKNFSTSGCNLDKAINKFLYLSFSS